MSRTKRKRGTEIGQDTKPHHFYFDHYWSRGKRSGRTDEKGRLLGWRDELNGGGDSNRVSNGRRRMFDKEIVLRELSSIQIKTPKDTPITITPQSCPDCGCTSFKHGGQSLHCYEIDFDCGFTALMLFSNESGLVYKECKAN